MLLSHVYCLLSVAMFLIFSGLFVSATVRRLYDIANILISLQLIQKLSGAELKSRKALFMYIGPQSNDMRSMY